MQQRLLHRVLFERRATRHTPLSCGRVDFGQTSLGRSAHAKVSGQQSHLDVELRLCEENHEAKVLQQSRSHPTVS